jgi:hypothetical protein
MQGAYLQALVHRAARGEESVGKNVALRGAEARVTELGNSALRGTFLH